MRVLVANVHAAGYGVLAVHYEQLGVHAVVGAGLVGEAAHGYAGVFQDLQGFHAEEIGDVAIHHHLHVQAFFLLGYEQVAGGAAGNVVVVAPGHEHYALLGLAHELFAHAEGSGAVYERGHGVAGFKFGAAHGFHFGQVAGVAHERRGLGGGLIARGLHYGGVALAHLVPALGAGLAGHFAGVLQLGGYHAGKFLYVVFALGRRQRRQELLHQGVAQHHLKGGHQHALGVGVGQQLDHAVLHHFHGLGVVVNELGEFVRDLLGVVVLRAQGRLHGVGFGQGGVQPGGFFRAYGGHAEAGTQGVYVFKLGGGRGREDNKG